jgi:hypothetical protein
MKTQFAKIVSVTLVCDFCKAQGFLDQIIFNHEGWYYCQNCLAELSKISKSLYQKAHQPSLF